jgi:hypothetical protein
LIVTGYIRANAKGVEALRQFIRAVAAALCFFLFTGASALVGRAAEPASTLNAGPKMPILAWGGVPYDKTSPQRYAELAQAGFNVNYYHAPDAATVQRMLDAGEPYGVKQLIGLPELERDPEGTAKRFKDHPALAGYSLGDEPGAKRFPALAAWAKRIQSVDSTHPCYLNLLPTYGNPLMWETPTYQQYLERFVAEVPVPMLSWDHYPVVRRGKEPEDDQLRADFYENLELCAAAGRGAKRPLWAFVMATAHAGYPIPTVAHLRVQAFSNLAYGTQTIQYFLYWTQKSTYWKFHDGPIDVDGNRTPVYDRVKQVNGEIQALRGAFVGTRVVAVGHTGSAIPAGTTRYTPAGPVKSLETEGVGAVVSMLERGGRRFLAVVNRDIHEPMPLAVSFDPAATVEVAGRDGSLTPVDVSGVTRRTLEPGDIAVFVWPAR